MYLLRAWRNGRTLDYGARAGGSTRLISIVANFKRLNFQVAEGTRGALRKAWWKETRKGSRCHAATSIRLTVAERGHNHHNDNYVGKCGYGRSGEGGKETGRRFLRRPAASFDPSLIIVVSIELIATLALARRLFDRSRFFNPLLVSLPLPSSHVHATLSCKRRCSSDDFSPCRANRGSVTWDHVSRFTKKSGSSSRERGTLSSSGKTPRLSLCYTLYGLTIFYVNLNRETLTGAMINL